MVVRLLLVVVIVVVVVAVQLPIALLPLDLVVLQGTIITRIAARRHRDSGRGLAATGGGMMVALMVVRCLSRRAPLH